MQRTRFFLALAALAIVALVAGGFAQARADPVVRYARVTLPDWPRGAAPQRIVLVSDIHIGSAAMDAARLTRIVGQINALSPDLVLLAGDFVYGHDPDAAVGFAHALRQPLAGLRARLGAVAVLGNHDYWTQPLLVRRALEQSGITVLANSAVVRGPLAIGGMDDAPSGHNDLDKTLAAMDRINGARIMVAHAPDIAPHLPPSLSLLLAGHTHCGQAVLPLIGPVVEISSPRYRCGVIRDPGHVTIVTGGLGTSGPPLRYGAPPDLWVVTVGGRPTVSRSRS